jgi:galactose mutarotase-like enzyme
VLEIAADKYLPVDEGLIPTGELADVAGTPLDFTKPEKIGARLDQIEADPVGYDHCYALRGEVGEMKLAARVKDPESGRVMEIHTTQPGLQFYSGNFLDGSADNGGYQQYDGFCLETQHFPDSPNQARVPQHHPPPRRDVSAQDQGAQGDSRPIRMSARLSRVFQAEIASWATELAVGFLMRPANSSST